MPLFPGTKRADIYKNRKGRVFSEVLFDRWRSFPTDIGIVSRIPAGIDLTVFQYELIRLFCVDFNRLLNQLITSNECSCSRMNATDEWHFLCAAHRKPQECSALEYMKHTVDGSVLLLLSSKNFPSRENFPRDNSKFFNSMLRRLYRIFAHLHFHHEEFFERFEQETKLCTKFTHFVQHFKLVSEETIIIPSKSPQA